MARAAIDDRTFGNGDHGRAAAAFDDRIGVHIGFQDAVRVGKLDPHAGRARFLVEHGVDEADFAGEGPAGIAARCHRDRLAGRDQTEVALGHVGQHPDHGEIGNAEQNIARLRLHALDHIVLDDKTVARRGPGHGQRALPALFNLRDDFVRNAKIFQPLARPAVLRQAARVTKAKIGDVLGGGGGQSGSCRRASWARPYGRGCRL